MCFWECLITCMTLLYKDNVLIFVLFCFLWFIMIDYHPSFVGHLVWAAVKSLEDNSFENSEVIGWIGEIISELKNEKSFEEVKQKVKEMINAENESKSDEKDNLVQLPKINSKKDILMIIDSLPANYFTMDLKCCIIYKYGCQTPSYHVIAPYELCVFFDYNDFRNEWVNEEFHGIKRKDQPRAQAICAQSSYIFIQAGGEYRQVRETGM